MITADDEDQWEARKRDLLHLFGSISKSSGLAGKVESQVTLVALDQVLSMAPVGGPVDLTPFDAFLMEKVSDVGIVNQAMVFYEFRAAKIGVQMLLPERLGDLDPAEREGILSDWSGQSQAVTYALKEAPPEGSGSGPKTKTATFSKKKKREGTHPAYFVVMLLAFAGLGGSFYYQEVTAGPKTRTDVTLPKDDTALDCVKVLAVEARVSCKVSKAKWDKYSKAERSVRIEETKRLAESKGFNELIVIVNETGQFIGRF